jgi:hypothetical protein
MFLFSQDGYDFNISCHFHSSDFSSQDMEDWVVGWFQSCDSLCRKYSLTLNLVSHSIFFHIIFQTSNSRTVSNSQRSKNEQAKSMNSLQCVASAIQTQNWQNAVKILSNDYDCKFLSTDDLYEVFERFLFSIERYECHTIQEEEELDNLVKTFLCRLSLFDGPLFSSHPASSFSSIKDHDCDGSTIDFDLSCAKSSLVHNLCMEHKHQALKLLLRNLDPCVASREASRCTSLSVDFVEDACGFSVYRDALFYHSPLQAAWEGFLFDHSSCLDHDLTEKEEWDDLWKTTVYILLAFDRQPIDYNHVFSGKWNIIHAIARYGHRAPSVVMSCALKLYPEYTMCYDAVGNLPLHMAVSRCQIDYRSLRYELDQGGTPSPSAYDNQLKYVTQPSCDTKNILIRRNPISMLVNVDSSAASRFDPNGRLPLHAFILHQHENSKIFESMKNQVGYFTDGHHFDPITSLKCIMDANPNALEYPEPFTGLFPFLLAATNNHEATLDTIFLLLRENPGVLEATCSSLQEISKRKQSNKRTSSAVLPTSPTSVCRVKRVVSPEMWTCSKRL